MKDTAHHLRSIQKKVIRESRQEELKNHNQSLTAVQANGISIPEVMSPENTRSRKLTAPKMVKAKPAYH